jgi:hypothetical protein
MDTITDTDRDMDINTDTDADMDMDTDRELATFAEYPYGTIIPMAPYGLLMTYHSASTNRSIHLQICRLSKVHTTIGTALQTRC